ncbi:MAG: hypothetical protein PHW96_00115 [Candidatus Nanoarchaeia archaeon]|nr:hypothetical protein [Candidatus Nanoarchaeia archaeon]
MENTLNKKAVLDSIEDNLRRIKDESSYLEKELKAEAKVSILFDIMGAFGFGGLLSNLDDKTSYIMAFSALFGTAAGIYFTYKTLKDISLLKTLGRENMEQIRKDVDKMRKYNWTE